MANIVYLGAGRSTPPADYPRRSASIERDHVAPEERLDLFEQRMSARERAFAILGGVAVLSSPIVLWCIDAIVKGAL